MGDLIQLYPEPISVLDACNMALDCKEVIVIGMLEDQTLHLSISGKPSVYEVIGLLERAKHSLIEAAKVSDGI